MKEKREDEKATMKRLWMIMKKGSGNEKLPSGSGKEEYSRSPNQVELLEVAQYLDFCSRPDGARSRSLLQSICGRLCLANLQGSTASSDIYVSLKEICNKNKKRRTTCITPSTCLLITRYSPVANCTARLLRQRASRMSLKRSCAKDGAIIEAASQLPAAAADPLLMD
jgi:hypothetical protein